MGGRNIIEQLGSFLLRLRKVSLRRVLSFCSCLQELVPGEGPEGLGGAWTQPLKAATCVLTPLNFSTSISTAILKSPEGKTLMLDRVSHKWLSITTIAAMDRPIEQATCLVARRARSVAMCSLATALGYRLSPWLWSLIRSAWYACRTAMVYREPPLWHATVYDLPTCLDDVWHGLDGKTGAFSDKDVPGER